jgi:hypothetical protein
MPLLGTFAGASAKNFGFSKGVTRTLAEAVGITPNLHYQSSDLSGYADGSLITSWVNRGSYGSAYNLVPSGTITKTTSVSYPAAFWNGSNEGMYFSGNQRFVLVPANSNPTFTVLYVYTTAATSGQSQPSFVGHVGPARTDTVEGGIYGLYSGTNYYHWYDNDGGYQAGGVPPVSVTTANQWTYRVSGGTETAWYGRTQPQYHGPQTYAGNGYGANIPITGLGGVRRHDGSTTFLANGNLFEAALWVGTALNDSQIANLRNYIGSTFQSLGAVNN